jgi:hypothetical protein
MPRFPREPVAAQKVEGKHVIMLLIHDHEPGVSGGVKEN